MLCVLDIFVSTGFHQNTFKISLLYGLDEIHQKLFNLKFSNPLLYFHQWTMYLITKTLHFFMMFSLCARPLEICFRNMCLAQKMIGKSSKHTRGKVEIINL